MSRRRLAAIMFTDMVGYTALGQKNESLSLSLIGEQRKLIRAILNRHHGREVKTMGDSFLAEFTNALDAVRCAYDIQRASREFNISQEVEARIRLRVGLHVGDVEEVNGDILGDAVNLASRIEALAEDGGVCLTRQIHDQVQNKISLLFSSLGTKSLKNVTQPTEVYRMVMPWEEEKTTHSAQLDKKRIAVLPFTNISPDPADEYFADGTTEEMISTLSGIHDLSVISRTSVMNYKNAKKNLADIGRELRTGTILEGSVRKAGNHVRITVQILNVDEDRHVWTQTYDRELQDIFAVQSDIAKSVAEVVKVELLAGATSLIDKKPTTSTEAYLQYLRGRQEWNRSTEEAAQRAIEFFAQALDHDKNFALAHVGLADSYILLVDYRGTSYAEGTALAKSSVLSAIRLDERLADAHATYGRLLEYEWEWDSSEKEFKRAIELNPSYAAAHSWYSDLLEYRGQLDKSLAEAQRALELDPLSAAMTSAVAFRFLFMERWDEAIEYHKRALTIRPNSPGDLAGISLAYSGKGERGAAMAWIEKYTQNSPSPWAVIWLAVVQALNGNGNEARRNLERALKRPDSAKIPPTWLAHALAALGDEDKTLELLEQALEHHDPRLAGVKYGPVFKRMRSNPRFLNILKKMGLDGY